MRSRMVLILSLLAASLSIASPVGATPTPPVLMVNNSTKQCAMVIQGDDCHWCDPPEGWEILEWSPEATCPAGYEDLGFQGMAGICRGYKNQFCCSNFQHHGDCEDLIINESDQLCAFVEEIRDCTLPEGWTSAADTTRWFGRCPYPYQWIPDITCVTAPKVAEPTAVAPTTTTAPTITSTVLPTHTSTPTFTVMAAPTATQATSSEDRLRPGIVWGSVVALGGLFVAVIWLVLKRSRRR